MEDLKKDVKKLETKLDQNVEIILDNMNKLHAHDEQIKNNSKRIKKNSYALEILNDYKKDKIILVTLLVIFIIAWIITFGALAFTIFKWVL